MIKFDTNLKGLNKITVPKLDTANVIINLSDEDVESLAKQIKDKFGGD